MSRGSLLLVDDDPGVRFGVCRFLETQGFQVVEAEDCAGAVEAAQSARPDAAVVDHQLPDGNALGLLEKLHGTDPELPVIVLTGHGSIELAVEAMRRGAEHFLTKPADLRALASILGRCLERRKERRRGRAAQAEERRRRPDPFLGDSAAIRQLARQAERIAASDHTVLLLGETGTGKGVLARWLHDHGPRSGEPFVALNCAAFTQELLESELFGHEKGAFTGAVAAKPGLFEVADRGTLFLDEIGDLALELQPKLLTALESGTFRRVGGVKDRRVDLRLIAATHHDLDERVEEGKLRADLYYRIHTVALRLSPLRERLEDLPTLARALLLDLSEDAGRPFLSLAPAAETRLAKHSWPGNIRELKNVLERAMLFADSQVLYPADLQFETATPTAASVAAIPERLSLEDLETVHIERVLGRSKTVSEAAGILGISRTTLYHKMRRYGLEKG
jgi:DNA-binding NtrC family response regulator